MLQNYECEQKRLQTEIEEWKAALDDAGQKVTDLRLLLRTLREITEIKELTPTLVNTLIERIEVHNNDKSSGHCYVKVDVYFTAVGMIDIPTEQENSCNDGRNAKKSSAVSFYRIIRKTVQPISELHRIGIKLKHPYVVLAFLNFLFYFSSSAPSGFTRRLRTLKPLLRSTLSATRRSSQCMIATGTFRPLWKKV